MERVTSLLKIKYPIIQGAMAWISDAVLAAAVSNAGGLGIIAAGSAPASYVKEQIMKARELTDKPFGVNIMLMSPEADSIAQLVCSERVAAVTTGAGSPAKYIESFKKAGISVLPVVASSALAARMERMGADAVIAEGCEAGGHIGELTTMVLTPAVCRRVKIPVISAGGIADARSVAAAFILGAEGVQVGTRFAASSECTVHQNYKDKIISAKETDTAVTGRSTGHPCRVLRNNFTRAAGKLEEQGISAEEMEKFLSGTLRPAAREGDVIDGSVMAGQCAALINDILPAGEIIKDMMTGAMEILSGVSL